MKLRTIRLAVLLAFMALVGVTLAAQDEGEKKKSDVPEKKKTDEPGKKKADSEKKKGDVPDKKKSDVPEKKKAEEPNKIIKKEEKEEIRIIHPDGGLQTIIRSGENQAWLGAMLASLTPEDLKRLALQDEKGALIKQVLPKSPAEAAGLKADDVIIEIEHKSMDRPEEVVAALGTRKPDEKITIVVRRDKQLKHLTVTLGKRPAMVTAVAGGKTPTLFRGDGALQFMGGKSITCPHCKRSTTVHSFGPMVMKPCPKCERIGQPGYKYCPYDGAELPGGGDSDAKFCPFCGKGLAK